MDEHMYLNFAFQIGGLEPGIASILHPADNR